MWIHPVLHGPLPFIKGQVLVVLYIDNGVFFSPDADAIQQEIKSIQKSFDLTDEGDLQDYLGTCFHKTLCWLY